MHYLQGSDKRDANFIKIYLYLFHMCSQSAIFLQYAYTIMTEDFSLNLQVFINNSKIKVMQCFE